MFRRLEKLCWVLVVVLTACKGAASECAMSTGRPYEVQLTGDEESVVARWLSEPITTLPQPEPCFDVVMGGQDGNAGRMARNRVVVQIDSAQFHEPAVRIERQVDAVPQTVIYVQGPSVQSLRKHGDDMGARVRQALFRQETAWWASYLKSHRNLKAEQTLYKHLQVQLWVPADMQSERIAERFVWFSNQAARGMQNLCVYSVPLPTEQTAPLSLTRLRQLRDSVMRVNLKGETDAMYMQTVPGTLTQGPLVRGLWEMQGDAMGGPFSCRMLLDRQRGCLVVAEAFVYAPEMKKRNLIRQLEVALFTLKTGRK